MGGVDAVGAVLDEDEFAARDGVVGAFAAGFEGDDGVGVAVNDQGRDGDLGQVVAEVGVSEGGDAVAGPLRGGERGDVSGVDALRFADFQLAAGGEESRS